MWSRGTIWTCSDGAAMRGARFVCPDLPKHRRQRRYAGGAVGRRMFWHVPGLRPALFMAWTMMVATSLSAHTLFLGLLRWPQRRILDSAAAIAVLLAGRAGTSAVFSRRPARHWVSAALAGR